MSVCTLQCSIIHACMLQSLLFPEGVTAFIHTSFCKQKQSRISSSAACGIRAYSNAGELIGAGWQH